MHEFSLCEGIIHQVSRANNNNLENVEQINLEIGKLAGVDLNSLLFWFPVVAEKLNCKHIKLNVVEPLGIANCKNCTKDFELVNLYDQCPHCNSFGNYEIKQGRELLVKSFNLISKQ